MSKSAKIGVAYGALAGLTVATLIVGYLYHAVPAAAPALEPWVRPLCILTGVSAPAVARFVQHVRGGGRP